MQPLRHHNEAKSSTGVVCMKDDGTHVKSIKDTR
jgi:hypothetical protein